MSREAADNAFTPELCPVAASCRWCGTEILHGPETTYLDAELGFCSSCPPTELRPALRAGIVAGMGSARDEVLAASLWQNPYGFGSDAWTLWKLGWWAGFFASDDDPGRRAGRYEVSVWLGQWRPCGAMDVA